MNDTKLTPQTLSNILFIIPDYQRGYRWTATEVKKLLNDLVSFRGDEYCLQPLELQEIKENDARTLLDKKWQEGRFKKFYRLVDGQQRLTTLSLLFQTLYKEKK